jgi:hypothetical protein
MSSWLLIAFLRDLPGATREMSVIGCGTSRCRPQTLSPLYAKRGRCASATSAAAMAAPVCGGPGEELACRLDDDFLHERHFVPLHEFSGHQTSGIGVPPIIPSFSRVAVSDKKPSVIRLRPVGLCVKLSAKGAASSCRVENRWFLRLHRSA